MCSTVMSNGFSKNKFEDTISIGRECLISIFFILILVARLMLFHCLPLPLILQAMSLDAACLGNHDLDLGLIEFAALRDKCTFPWVCSNVRHVPSNNTPLGGCKEYAVIDKKNPNGTTAKLLVLGLVEEDWIDTLSSVEPHDIAFEDYCAYVKRRVPEVRIILYSGPKDKVTRSYSILW